MLQQESRLKVADNTGAKEQRAAKRHLAASKRPSRTPEERQAERNAERARKARLRRSRRLKAHDEANQAGVGDRVRIMETRPLSATKRWRLISVLEKAK
jgi:small subunit ribosomal protein S17